MKGVLNFLNDAQKYYFGAKNFFKQRGTQNSNQETPLSNRKDFYNY